MADSKISALPASTTPLAGSEVLPIVQSGATKQVSVANLTTGRAISATQLTLTTGNVIVANGQGIDFSATPGTGTSELFADYEEGTWTPVATWATPGSGTSVGPAYYTKVGRTVTLLMYITATKGTASGKFTVTGVPYASATSAACASRIDGMGAASKVVGVNITSTTMNFDLMNQSTSYATSVTAAEMANDCYIQVTCTYNI